MKKTLLLGLLAFAGFTANAQLAPGSQAPDFTATDINGNTHKLSDYLAAGKTVILDVSATWCGPCWQFHSSHALADLHNSYGPWGSGEIVVLFVEGDPATSINNIHGINEQGYPPTQGNWAANTPYPIIDSAEISDLYNIAYFPTLYRICPNGIVNEIQPAVAATIKGSIDTGCGTLEGAQNHIMITEAPELRICDAETAGNQAIDVSFKNYGPNAVTSGTAVVKQGETVVATQEFTANVAQYAGGTVTIEDVPVNGEGDYSVEINTVNGSAPYSWWAYKQDLNIEAAAEVTNNVIVNVYTDNYPSEISWNIKDSSGAIVASGGPYEPGTDDEYGGGGVDANTTKSHEVTLPEGIDCYSIELLDSFGDGWKYGSTTHGMEIFTAEGSAHYILVGSTDFGESLVQDAALRTNGTLNNQTFETDTFKVYPNPTTGILNFATQETVSVTVMDLTGKTVFKAENINNGDSINLNTLQTGMYIAKIKSETAEKIEKIVIK